MIRKVTLAISNVDVCPASPSGTFADTIVAYMKRVKEEMQKAKATEDEVKEFEKGAAAYAKKIVANFKDYEFLIGESMDPEGM